MFTFNSDPPSVMHIDVNSCFATIEQQANPLLRGKPIAVAAYNSPGGCILAPSREAKLFGVKTGMRVRDGMALCPNLLVLTGDPQKYRYVHKKMHAIMADYTSRFSPKSIDEFVLHFPTDLSSSLPMLAQEIKARIRSEIGEWISVSVGISVNRFLAKTAAGLKKPDGLELITSKNYREVYSNLTLMDLCGINTRNQARLNRAGIYTVLQMYEASVWDLRVAFESVLADYWFARLRGWEVDSTDFGRKSFGNSYSLPKSSGTKEELLPILQKLTEKTTARMREQGCETQGISLWMSFRGGGGWHRSKKLHRSLFSSVDIYQEIVAILGECPTLKPVHTIAVSCFHLSQEESVQLEVFDDVVKKRALSSSIDAVNDRYGKFVLVPARVMLAKSAVPDRIAFGKGGL